MHDYEPIDDDICSVDFHSAALEQRVKKEEVLGNYFSDNSFETISVLTRSQIARTSPVDDNMDSHFIENDWLFKMSEPQALYGLDVLLSTLKLLEKQKYDPFWKLILATKAIYPNSGFNDSDDGVLPDRYHRYLAYSRLLCHLVSEVDFVPRLTITSC